MSASPAGPEMNIKWNGDCCEALRASLITSAYSNYLSDEAMTREAYGPNYDRLAALNSKV
jgi:hypothetical protein